MTQRRVLKIGAVIMIAGASLLAAGCVPLAVGAGAAVGVAAAKEGGLPRAVNDTSIRMQITDLWLKHDVHMYRRLNMRVNEGRVLITGTVPTPDARVDAVRLAWQADGVTQVINEINVDNSSGIGGYATDAWITGQIKSRLLFDKYIQSINYTVDTVDGTVYLMGVAQDQKELDRALNHARTIGRVRNVVSYVRLRGETPPALKTPAAGTDRSSATTGNTGWTTTTRTGIDDDAYGAGPGVDRSVSSETLLPP